MAINVNKAIIVGRLGADPDVKRDDFVTLSVATSESWKDKQTGDRVERTQWHKVVIFNAHHAKFAADYAKKGDMVMIEGTIETRKYEKDGQEVWTTEIVLRPFSGSLQIQSKGPRDEQEERRPAQRREEKPEPKPQQKREWLDDDEIPF